MSNARTHGRIWIATVPRDQWEPSLPDQCNYIKGQLERGDSGYEHWQFLVYFKRTVRLSAVKKVFPVAAHYELTRSSAAEEYVFKEETSLGERFEFGKKPFKRNSAVDWDLVKLRAKEGNLDHADIPSDIFVRHFHSLRSIARDFVRADYREIKEIALYWGPTHTGKSYVAHQNAARMGGEAGFYPKNVRTKFWDGYRGEEAVVFDEFRGAIAVDYLLRWFDRYPCFVETKGSTVPLKATSFYLTSNIRLEDWYNEIDNDTLQALKRRFTVIEHKDIVFLNNNITN